MEQENLDSSLLQYHERYNLFRDSFHISEKTILFESMAGERVSGNPLALFKFMMADERFQDYTFIWTVNSDNIIPEKYRNLPNVFFIRRFTDLYFKYLSSAQILISNEKFPEFFARKDEQTYLNTWHGTPWKTLGYDVKSYVLDYANAARNYLQATHLILPNQYTYKHQIVPNQVAGIHPASAAVTGYPRIDLTYESMEQPGVMKQALGINDNKSIILYAPTWRGENAFRQFDKKRLEADLKRLSMLDAHIVFRGHHIASGLLSGLEIPNVIVVPENFDTNELLGVVDLLITDYSSLFFDFLITNKPIIHYVYDYDTYVSDRGLYFSLDNLPGTVAGTSDEMIAAAQNYLHRNYQPTKQYLNAQAHYNYMDDGNAAKRVIDWVIFGTSSVNLIKQPGAAKEKILFYAGDFKPGRETTSFINLTKSIDKQRYNITVVVSHSIMAYPENLEQLDKIEEDTNILPVVGNMNDKDYQKEFKRVFGAAHFDYLIDYSGYSSYFNQLLASNPDSKAKNIICIHEEITSEISRKYPTYDKIISPAELTNKLTY